MDSIDLFNGQGGTVIVPNQEVNTSFGTLKMDDGHTWVNGVEMTYGDEVCSVNEIAWSAMVDLHLLQDEAYRGTGCYEGVGMYDGKLVGIDIVSEGMVYELIQE